MKNVLILLLAGICSLAWAQTNAPMNATTNTLTATATNALPATPMSQPTNTVTTKLTNTLTQQTVINSDSADFDLNTRRAVYHGHVVIDDPRVILKCAQLIVDIPEPGHRLSHVVAETNVMIDFTDNNGNKYHVTSNKAVYDYSLENSVTNETVTFTGHPLVKTAQGTMSSEPLIWNRTENRFIFKNYHGVLPANVSGGTNAGSLDFLK